jgi:hypothetical protein
MHYSPIPNQLIYCYNSEYKLVKVTKSITIELNIKQNTIILDTSKQYKEWYEAEAGQWSKQLYHSGRNISNSNYIASASIPLTLII